MFLVLHFPAGRICVVWAIMCQGPLYKSDLCCNRFKLSGMAGSTRQGCAVATLMAALMVDSLVDRERQGVSLQVLMG